ncbi:unnamed protein product [Rotaria magnacalcarata]|uniref:Uncharacterized protein n=1 Tax=Rotaria magnacalcarata TaxID=392030 RepID=A0A815WCT9_9BILA|nr:unnamed protein product [Rotaria magnacalcarata]CAF1543677.1 unnamed protein product [Rotaria magnacalcarata]
MYNTGNHQDRFCLSYVEYNKQGSHTHIIATVHVKISYCLRISEDYDPLDLTNIYHPMFTFLELESKNISSSTLLSWSTSLDFAEQYQNFLDKNSNPLVDGKLLFYNCTSPWFGPFCRFTFDYNIDKTFKELVRLIFLSKKIMYEDTKVACYQHLKCDTLISCLDWRDICDRKRDCLDGSDEKHCWKLEINQCAEDEYRCHNGQCIPVEFLQDSSIQSECLDKTDESFIPSDQQECREASTFQCEEHMCRPGIEQFSCGDGQCTNGIIRCDNGRSSLLPPDFCSNVTACSMITMGFVDGKWCKTFCPNLTCVKERCQASHAFRYAPELYGHVRLMYKSQSIETDQFPLPEYICYDKKLCSEYLPTNISIGNMSCRYFNDLGLDNSRPYENLEQIVNAVREKFRACLVIVDENNYCNYSTVYQCHNSKKCISKSRLLDGFVDCPFCDDETFNQSCSLSDRNHRFKCYDEDHDKCFALLVYQDQKRDCKYGEDERDEFESTLSEININILFQNICDGKQDFRSILIDDHYETDETDCQVWPCNNTYTRCDQFWSCTNGADEVNCPPSTCPSLEHSCVFPNDTSKISCLPITRVGDNISDCLGATDERVLYVTIFDNDDFKYNFQCWNDSKTISSNKICNNYPDCSFHDDENVFCRRQAPFVSTFCDFSGGYVNHVQQYFCQFTRKLNRPKYITFKLSNIVIYPKLVMSHDTPNLSADRAEPRIIKERLTNYVPNDYAWSCIRGIPIRVRLEGNESKSYCLCPPSYYGAICEYQNERVSLTIRIRITSDWRSVFVFLITLIDNEGNIESHDTIEYLPSRYCHDKFNLYLLYSSRPKNVSKNYSVQIDAYNQMTLNYRASWIFSIKFPFLPVYHLAAVLKVPFDNVQPIQTCRSPCIHGQCFNYINDPSSTLCRCHAGWSGMQCSVKQTCDCAPSSICISNSICLCRLGRFGARCYLRHTLCDSNSCLNNGQCLPWDPSLGTVSQKNAICICPPGYVGAHCENLLRQTRIDVSFHPKIAVPPSILLHLITFPPGSINLELNRMSIMKKLAFDQDSLVLNTSFSFNLALTQISTNYYLIILQEHGTVSEHISTQIVPSNRCPSINEIFNETFATQHILKRIKRYHVPCEQSFNLMCFHDNYYICLCNLDYQSNCFPFDHNMTYTCTGYNFCKNGGFCFVDNRNCPTSSFCVCRQCYFGSRCQFSTEGSTLSLDIILGYQIKTKTSLYYQPKILKLAIVLTTIMYVFGIVNAFLCFQTFRRKQTQNVGCGLYLLATSIASFATMLIFKIKFWFLLASKIGWIDHRSFLNTQCTFFEFSLRLFLNAGEWLTASVGIERAVNVTQGVNFNKAKSVKVAKWIILFVFIGNISTLIYDPMYRRLIDDEEEQRTWCVTNYSPSVGIFDVAINIFHFCIPFAMNCISALVIIYNTAYIRAKSQEKISFKQNLYKQIAVNKHLLISPFLLIILALPRLIISFLSGCMKSVNDSWFYLMGHFISFIPSMMTFAVFVLPSDMYKKEFKQFIRNLYH